MVTAEHSTKCCWALCDYPNHVPMMKLSLFFSYVTLTLFYPFTQSSVKDLFPLGSQPHLPSPLSHHMAYWQRSHSLSDTATIFRFVRLNNKERHSLNVMKDKVLSLAQHLSMVFELY